MATEPLQSEQQIIQEFLAPLAASAPGAFGLADDCAIFGPTPGHDLVLKTDPIAAGVHFFADDAPADIAWKALAVNVSDLAAKGARPRGYLMALSFAEPPMRAWMAAFATGLAAAQQVFGMVLLGGDTDRRPGPLTVSITVLGEVPAGRMVRRGGAVAGDRLFVTGTIGDAWLGLQLRAASARARSWPAALDRARLVGCYLRPDPPLALAPAILALASGAMDLSDGLVKDAGRMARAAGVHLEIAAEKVPLSADARALAATDASLFSDLVTGGDDYQVLAAVAPSRAAEFVSAAQAAGVQLTEIGVARRGPAAAAIVDARGQPLHFARTGYDHF